jgi:AAA domain
MLSAALSAGVRLPPVSETEVSAGVFTNRKLPEPQWEKPLACRADEGPIKEVQWLWPGRIPVGKVTLLTGPAGAGKSLVALDLAARVSRGQEFPRSEADRIAPDRDRSSGSVLVVAPVHEAEDVVRPRLRDLGADLSKIHLLFGVFDASADRLLALPNDINSMEHFLEELHFPQLVIVDGKTCVPAGGRKRTRCGSCRSWPRSTR